MSQNEALVSLPKNAYNYQKYNKEKFKNKLPKNVEGQNTIQRKPAEDRSEKEV